MMVVVLLQPLPFAPNLFCSTGLDAQLTLCRSKGWWKLTKLNPASLLAYEEVRSFFHRNHFFAITLSVIVALQCHVYPQSVVYLLKEQK